jgi:hypothetical protein
MYCIPEEQTGVVILTNGDNTDGHQYILNMLWVFSRDSDLDGVIDGLDTCPDDPGNDVDNDLICAADDNCVDIPNPDQEDTDGDGVGNACCCVTIRGNVDSDTGDVIDISDLVYLVDYMFSGGLQPGCPMEADIDPNGAIDISDLVYLVDYMFTGGQPPPACP